WLREPRLREPWLREPRLREPWLREPRLREPRLRKPRLREPRLRRAQPRVRRSWPLRGPRLPPPLPDLRGGPVYRLPLLQLLRAAGGAVRELPRDRRLLLGARHLGVERHRVDLAAGPL